MTRLCIMILGINHHTIMQKKGIILSSLMAGIIMLVVPFSFIFDVLQYFITRPSCLTCNTLPDFLRTGSLTFFLLTSAGYKLKK